VKKQESKIDEDWRLHSSARKTRMKMGEDFFIYMGENFFIY